MNNAKFAVLGCGFWSKFQIGAWGEVEGAELSAVYNRTLSKGEAENTGADNLETVRLIWASYKSASTGKMIKIIDFN